ncbi:MAG: heme exporter protein CcmB [Moraxellaceae bacterium]|nr:MAG: heme exporter protein CcmB [Moraxellaceae bacterium]
MLRMDKQSSLFWATFKRDLTLAFRHKSDMVNPLVFFLIAITMIPLALGPEKAVLMRIAPGIIWVMALLATLLSLDNLFRSDFDDGSLEQLLISPYSLTLSISAKILVHWLATGLPLTLLAPLLGVMLSLPLVSFKALVWSLLLGTAVMSLIGSVGAALTVSLRKGGILISLIVMPLYIPVLIFGASAVQTAALGEAYNMQLAVLGAGLAIALVFAPIAAAGALRVSVNG